MASMFHGIPSHFLAAKPYSTMVSGHFFALASHSAEIFPHLTGVPRTSLRTLFVLTPRFFALFVLFFALYLHSDSISSHFSRFSSHCLCTLFALFGGFFALR